jgi:hypothetical protein
VRVGINPGIPALPPERGQLSGDPVRFGSSDILSFSPLGTATPGTFYRQGIGCRLDVSFPTDNNATRRGRLIRARSRDGAFFKERNASWSSIP